MPKIIDTDTFRFNDPSYSGLNLSITTHTWHDPRYPNDKWFTQNFTQSIHGNIVEFRLGYIFTPFKLRELADQIEKLEILAKLGNHHVPK